MNRIFKNIVGALLIFVVIFVMDLATDFSALETPLLFTLAIAFIALITAYLLLKKDSITKTALFNIAILFLFLIIIEKTLQVVNKRKSDPPYKVFEAELFDFHPTLGYRHKKNWKKNVFAKFGDSLIFNVQYNLDKNGLRIAPPFEPVPESKSIVFFGCSFTFGYGLKDYQALPYIVGDLNPHYKTYNFGTNAYGPHQMLKSLESNLVDSIIDVEPQYCIYTAIPTHIERAVRFYSTDYNGYDPKYILNKDGWPEYVGPFVQDSSSLGNKIATTIKESAIYSSLFRSKPDDSDVELFASIIAATKKQIKQKYPNCEFHMLFWDDQSSDLSNKAIKLLQEKHIKLHLISTILPKNINHAIFPGYENHPSYLANQYIAKYIKERIIRPI